MLPIVVFLFVTTLILGVYFASVSGMTARRDLDRRLFEISVPEGSGDLASTAPSLVRQPKEGPLPSIDRLVSRTRAGSGLALLIEQSGVKTTPSAVMVSEELRCRPA